MSRKLQSKVRVVSPDRRILVGLGGYDGVERRKEPRS